MRLYWYWPFLREEDVALVEATVRPGDELTVQVLDRPGAPRASTDPARRIVRDLREVAPFPEGSLRWVASRAATYAERLRRRRALLATLPVDVAHVHFINYFTDWIDLPLLRRRAPLVVSVHDAVPHHPRLPAWALERALRRIYLSADQLVVHHSHVGGLLTARFGIHADRISVVPHWVSPPPAPAGAKFAATRADHRATVLFFGTFRRNKGVDVLLEATARLAHRGDLRVCFAGRGASEVEDRIRRASHRDPRVTAEIGWVPTARKHELYARASLVVLPYTDFASQSGVLHDAYSHGVPVVVTDVGALGQTVRADGTGWVVPPGDPAALAAAIEMASTAGDQYLHAAAASRRQAAARHPRVIGEQFRQVYAEVASRVLPADGA